MKENLRLKAYNQNNNQHLNIRHSQMKNRDELRNLDSKICKGFDAKPMKVLGNLKDPKSVNNNPFNKR